MPTVTSADGTAIAYERTGAGPAAVVVAGAFCDRHTFAGLAALLSPDFDVHLYDRRGRGDSGDGSGAALGSGAAAEVEREVEDLAAVLDAAGGSALVFGHSSGAAVAMAAAIGGLPMAALAVYEPPFAVGADRSPDDGVGVDVETALAAGRPGDAVRAFLTKAVDVPERVVDGMAGSPVWARLCALAPSLLYDLAAVGDRSLPSGLETIDIPVLALSGGDSPPGARRSVEAVAAAVAGARSLSIPGQTHQVADEALAPVLTEFFATVRAGRH